ncbi:MAG: SGNH/GDSL hydrolase family protein [Clostridia bacterium]|nr:SGNH/GDSL hydrolase family protein [Clostridia bacterium]
MKNKIARLTRPLKLSYLPAALALALILSSCAPGGNTQTPSGTSDTPDKSWSAMLSEGEDMGEEYIDSFIFIGESTTAHLKSRGVLRDGKNTKQVWSPRSGTMNLDTTSAAVKIIFPDTGEEMTIAQAAAKKQPDRVLLTFGLNGAVQKIKMGEEYFKTCYRSLIEAIKKASPHTEIVIQSCFPVASSMDMSSYSVDAATLNSYISTINSWSLSLAAELGAGYLNTWEIMTDSEGFLKAEYNAGDGYHLTAKAYQTMLLYLRTHAFTEEI